MRLVRLNTRLFWYSFIRDFCPCNVKIVFRSPAFEYVYVLIATWTKTAMSGKNWLGLLAAAMTPIMSGLAIAADVTTFESCVDANGKTLPAVADSDQTMLVRTVTDQGQATIRYNPAVLPRLTFTARLFLYSHQCARQGVGDPTKPISVAQARQADCIGLNTLLTSNMLKREDLPALQGELSFSDAEWTLLPGPARTFDLANCRATKGNALRLPPNTAPTEKQVGWNNCARACADRLWTCQKRAGGGESEGCMEAYRQCKGACGEAAKPAAESPAD